MAFTVEASPHAARLLRKLPADVERRIVAKLRDVAEDPAGSVQRLTGIRAYKVHVGDYRVILDVDWDGEVISVLAVRHRKSAY